jgi:hypothetical protein
MFNSYRLAVAGLFAICGVVHAQIAVSGRVLDENGGAVPQASVRFQLAETTEPKVESSTGPGGNFAVTLPQPGLYRVTAICNGFFSLEDSPVQIDRDGSVQLILNHQTEILSSINVPSESNPVDVAQTDNEKTLSNLEILDMPYQGRDINSALKLIPGVVQDPQGGMHLSGSAANQVLYTLNGFNVTDPIGATFQTRVNVDSVRSVRYETGRYSPEFGKGSAGVVAIDTEMGNDAIRYNVTNFVPGVDTASGVHIGTWSPRFQLSGPIVKDRAWFSESATAVYSQSVVPDAKDTSRTSSLRADNLVRAQVNLTPTNLLFASFLVNASDAPGSGLSALDSYSTTLDRRARTWFFSLKHDYYLSRGAVLEWGYAEDRTLQRQVPLGDALYQITPSGHRGNFFLNSRESALRRQWLVNLTPKVLHLAGTHQLRAGVDADRLNYEVANRRTGYEMFGLNGTRLSQTTFQGSGIFSRPNTEASTYLLDAWKPKPGLMVLAGIRQDWDELLRNLVWSPRVSVSVSPFGWKNTKVMAGYAVTRDSSLLTQFARPLDQHAVTVNYNPDGSLLSGPAGTYFFIRPGHLRTPLYRNWSAGLEQRLPGDTLLTLNYQSRRGRDGLTYVFSAIPPDPAVSASFVLQNYGRDVFDSAEITVRRSFGKQYEWMVSYTRSRALSNSVIGYSVDQPLWSPNNVGRMPWDTPNHVLAWGYFPTPWPNWAVSALVEARDGLPFSVSTDYGAIVGDINSYRLPSYLDLDFHVERRLHLGKHYVAVRAGFVNLTNHQNPTVVNSVIGAQDFLTYYGSQGRHVVFRLRWLGKS